VEEEGKALKKGLQATFLCWGKTPTNASVALRRYSPGLLYEMENPVFINLPWQTDG